MTDREDFEKLVRELKNYTEQIRDDWSSFDGRVLRNYVNYNWIPRLIQVVGRIIEEQGKVLKK